MPDQPKTANIFFQMRHEYIHNSYPCHVRHLSEDEDIKPIYGIFITYNAITHLFKHYENYHEAKTSEIYKQDIGDYYAIRILEAVWLLVSQGKNEDL